MATFMDLAVQMCEESDKINASGQVKFNHFVEYFRQKSPSAATGVLTASGVGMNSLSMGQVSSLGGNGTLEN